MSAKSRARSKTDSRRRRTARAPHQTLSKEERILWKHLRDNRLGGYKFTREHRLETHEFAFYCPRANVAIEIARASRRDLPGRDYKRDAYLAAHGVVVLHFSAKEIRHELDKVLQNILAACRARQASRRDAPIAPVLAPTRATEPVLTLRRSASNMRIVGIALIGLIAFLIFFFLLSQTNRSEQGIARSPLATLTRGPTAAPRTPTPFLTETPFTILAVAPRPVRTPSLILAQAEKLIDSQPQRVLDLLVPELSRLDSKADLADAYFFLGRAELKLLHYRAAADYFKQLNALEPSVEYLYMLATASDLSGERGAALEYYRALAQWSGADALVYRDLAERRIKELSQATSSPTPSP